MNLNRAGITASLALWKRRQAYRQKRLDYWRGKAKAPISGRVVVTRQEAALIHKWENLKQQATEMVARREQQLAKLKSGSEPKHATRLTPNRSARNGVKPRVIVLHSTEGAYDGAVSWLCNSASQASAHVVVSKTGESTRLVPDAEKAWHVASDNPFTLGIEQEGFAAQASWPDAQLETTAAWIAYWARKYDIPIVHSVTHGVCQHSDLGAAGGGHHDCGPAYPFDRVLLMARA